MPKKVILRVVQLDDEVPNPERFIEPEGYPGDPLYDNYCWACFAFGEHQDNRTHSGGLWQYWARAETIPEGMEVNWDLVKNIRLGPKGIGPPPGELFLKAGERIMIAVGPEGQVPTCTIYELLESLESAFTAEMVKKGALLWYTGFTSRGSWDCPAVIHWVSKDGSQFKVTSLDDMRKQDSKYDTEIKAGTSDTRKGMRPTTPEEVSAYLDRQKDSLDEDVASAEHALATARGDVDRFDKVRAELKL